MDTKGTKSKNTNNFIVQGSILAIAGVLVRLLGLFKRIPLAYIIGNTGNGYYATAFDIYQIFYTISAYGIPVALSKLVSAKVSKGEYKNADKIFKCALKFSIVMGLLSSFVVFFFSNQLANAFGEPMSFLALRMISPTLLIVCVLSVFRGYYQGMGTMVPTAISQVIEQIFVVGVGIGGSYFLAKYGTKVGMLLHNENYKYSYGAAGAIAGCVAGAILALAFMLLMYKAGSRRFKRNIYKDPTTVIDSSYSIYRSVILTIIPIVISSSVTTVSGFCDHFIHNKVMDIKGFSELKTANWGIYSGKYMVLVSVVLALSSAMGMATVPTLSGHVKKKEFDIVKSKVKSVIRITMMVAIPAAAGLAALAPSVMYLLFSTTDVVAPTLLRIGSVGIVLFSLSSITGYILQGMSHLYVPIKHALIAMVIHLSLMTLLLFTTDLKVYAVALSNNVFALIMCILNVLAIMRILRCRFDLLRTFGMPFISSAVMGVAIYLIDKVLCNNGFSRIKIIFSIIIGAIIYALIMLLTRSVSAEELSRFPGGRKIARILEKIHLIR
ncbi:MAG: polysaccharide biosynthesis protein [Lachnospiraceae bacterium]|nr:polysaccharide biosynthesis protein [Lachnospiraceae bacterium]